MTLWTGSYSITLVSNNILIINRNGYKVPVPPEFFSPQFDPIVSFGVLILSVSDITEEISLEDQEYSSSLDLQHHSQRKINPGIIKGLPEDIRLEDTSALLVAQSQSCLAWRLALISQWFDSIHLFQFQHLDILNYLQETLKVPCWLTFSTEQWALYCNPGGRVTSAGIVCVLSSPKSNGFPNTWFGIPLIQLNGIFLRQIINSRSIYYRTMHCNITEDCSWLCLGICTKHKESIIYIPSEMIKQSSLSPAFEHFWNCNWQTNQTNVTQWDKPNNYCWSGFMDQIESCIGRYQMKMVDNFT